MKWTKANTEHICSVCLSYILTGQIYLTSPNINLCKKCGKKYQKGELIHDRKAKRYIDIKSKSTCDFCKDMPIGSINGKAVCQQHVPNAMGDFEL